MLSENPWNHQYTFQNPQHNFQTPSFTAKSTAFYGIHIFCLFPVHFKFLLEFLNFFRTISETSWKHSKSWKSWKNLLVSVFMTSLHNNNKFYSCVQMNGSEYIVVQINSFNTTCSTLACCNFVSQWAICMIFLQISTNIPYFHITKQEVFHTTG